jgi:hypothetical protein
MNELNPHVSGLSIRRISGQCCRFSIALAALALSVLCAAQAKPATTPDVLVLSNGDTLHGAFVSEIAGKVTFHSDVLGDVSLGWDKIKELHSSQKFAVVNDQEKPLGRKAERRMVTGSIDVVDQAVTIRPEGAPAQAAIPVEHAQFIMDAATLDKQLNHEPGFFQAWTGAATAGGTLVTATQNQYTFSGGIGLVRTVPSVSWLRVRNRTAVDFAGSIGKTTQPAYTNPGPPPVQVAAVVTKTAIYHADAERDEYLSPRFFALAETAFDHNFAQSLNLQQIYGGGLGWTALKTPTQEADLKATIQYEKQQFFGSGSGKNLVGSTIAASYLLHLKRLTYTQGLSFIPAFNDAHAYSVNESDAVAFPAYKNLSFSLGTLDSYLNDPPASLPPTKRNSFEFTMGFTYAIRSKY